MVFNCRVGTILFGFLVLFLFVSEALPEAPCENVIECPCGSSNQTFKLCNSVQSTRQNFCELFSRCTECDDYLNECLKCPEGINNKYCKDECGHSSVESSGRWISGYSLAGEWPWVVKISVVNSNTSTYICGGVLINPTTVLTAAHCAVAENVLLAFGSISYEDKDSEVQFRRSTKIIKHPDFDKYTYDSDIAVIRFSPRIHYTRRIRPICLPTPESTAINLRSGRRGLEKSEWFYNGPRTSEETINNM